MKTLNTHIVLAFTLLMVACIPAGAGEADKATIHAKVKEWSAAAQAKNPDSFASVYAPNAVVMLEGAPDMRGVEAIRAGIGEMMQDPNFSLSFEADDVVVAEAGDMAYETGTYALTVSDPEGNPASQHGHYVVVWQKQADGSWKVMVDAPISDPPEEEAEAEAEAASG